MVLYTVTIVSIVEVFFKVEKYGLPLQIPCNHAVSCMISNYIQVSSFSGMRT